MGEGADGHELFVSTQEASGMVAHRYRRSLVLHLRHILPSHSHMSISRVHIKSPEGPLLTEVVTCNARATSTLRFAFLLPAIAFFPDSTFIAMRLAT